jgi:hypothetical protein
MGVEMVVGQVADDAQALAQAARECGEVHRQHVGFDHLQVDLPAQARGEVAVELDHRQAACT